MPECEHFNTDILAPHFKHFACLLLVWGRLPSDGDILDYTDMKPLLRSIIIPWWIEDWIVWLVRIYPEEIYMQISIVLHIKETIE